MKRLLLALCLALVAAAPFHAAWAVNPNNLLPPAQAFRFSVKAVDAHTLHAVWDVADGYHIYRKKIAFKSDSRGITLGTAKIPQGVMDHDPYIGNVRILRHRIAITLPLQRAAGSGERLTLTATTQGCADAGVCYPPYHKTVTLTLPPQPAAAPAAEKAIGNLLTGESGGQKFLAPDKAFAFSERVTGPDRVLLSWNIAPHYHLYRDKFRFRLDAAPGTKPKVKLGKVTLPPGVTDNDPILGKVQIYHGKLQIPVPLVRSGSGPASATLHVRYQGCAEAGICYPPVNKTVKLALPAAAANAGSAAPSSAAPAASAPASAAAPVSEQNALARSLAGSDKLLTILTFFGLGLLLAFTPCIFPMIPILSSIIVGQGHTITTRRAFVLSLVYVLAMAITYTIAGVAAALFGANIQAAAQNPWILGGFAGVFVLLALSMFGFYELQLPSALQSRITALSNRQSGGNLIGVGVMGFLSALIVGPCVAPPLMGALIYIGQTGDAVLGGIALFALSLGMGTPLLAVGVSAGRFLPRAGGWMDAVKAVFGVLLLGVAVWMLERIVPAAVSMVLWAMLAIVSAIYMGALEPAGHGVSGWRRLWKGLGVVLLLYGALLLIGVASGGRNPLAPLSQFRLGGVAGAQEVGVPAHLKFTRVKDVAALKRALAAARARHQPVMLDYYADWCVSCKELDQETFSDPRVMRALRGAVLLRADVTDNSAADKALLHRYHLFGPPSILFFGPNGQERSNLRVVGFMNAGEFLAHVRRALR